MTPDEVNDFYLKVGGERRKDPKRGDTSKKFGRKVLGRKGVGKLAPFGICQKIEIITSGGEIISKFSNNGTTVSGYLTAHLILDQRDIMNDSDADYVPQTGEMDGTIRAEKGTTIKLSEFSYRQVPAVDVLARELAQRFGIASLNWEIKLENSAVEPGENICRVQNFHVLKMPETEIRFEAEKNPRPQSPTHLTYNHEGYIMPEIEAGFNCDGVFYPVEGWIAYAQKNYKDDLVAGIRIYCRGKITAQTSIFNLKSGFTGEYDVRSYIIGELHADWLDEKDDLIQTDRRDILWSNEIGQAFEEWGQSIVKIIGKNARNPIKKKVWDTFKEISNIEERAKEAFPTEEQKELRDRTISFANMIGRTMREGEVQDPEQVKAIVDLSIAFAPHVTLSEKLRVAGDENTSPLSAIASILKTAHVAELSSYGKIADDRIKVISRVEQLKDDPATLEAVFQELIESAPWLIDAQWSPIAANQAFSNLKSEFEKFYKKETKEEILLSDIDSPRKRPDFVLSNQEGSIQIIEIKKPSHNLMNNEMDRIVLYKDVMEKFLNNPANALLVSTFGRGFHITLVCDGLSLSGVHKTAFEGLIQEKRMTHINWASFLAKTRKAHEEFLREAERQKSISRHSNGSSEG
jgi:hypothetical protein